LRVGEALQCWRPTEGPATLAREITFPVDKLFISYRRKDSGPIARRLSETLARFFGEERVFLDTDSIRMGQNWASRITKALQEASVLLCVIGPEWLKIHNDYGQRRIDLEGDWVHEELVTAFDRGIPVVPILVAEARLPTAAALPQRIWPLISSQGYKLEDEHWQRDISPLIEELVSLGFRRIDNDATAEEIIYPPRVDRVKGLTPQELDSALMRLPDWRLVKRPQPGSKGAVRTELYRSYRFATFADAAHFMFAASRHAIRHSHHPDWQNLWINLQVWLTTWDIGHRPSFKDVRLAEYLDKLYEEYNVLEESEEDSHVSDGRRG
jgi:pterin-4a-carbinolamine dehydratase